jgi:hypothetical protein
MNSRRFFPSLTGHSALPPSPEPTAPPVSSTRFDEAADVEQFAVYGIKLWRWKFSLQVPILLRKVFRGNV